MLYHYDFIIHCFIVFHGCAQLANKLIWLGCSVNRWNLKQSEDDGPATRHCVAGGWAPCSRRHGPGAAAGQVRGQQLCHATKRGSLRLAPHSGATASPARDNYRHTLNSNVWNARRAATDDSKHCCWCCCAVTVSDICCLPSISRQAYTRQDGHTSRQFPAKMSTARYFVCVRSVRGCTATGAHSC